MLQIFLVILWWYSNPARNSVSEPWWLQSICVCSNLPTCQFLAFGKKGYWHQWVSVTQAKHLAIAEQNKVNHRTYPRTTLRYTYRNTHVGLSPECEDYPFISLDPLFPIMWVCIIFPSPYILLLTKLEM